MKTLKYVTIAISCMFFFSIAIQAQQYESLKIYFKKNSTEKIFSVDEKGEKKFTFQIVGLNNQEALEKFTSQFKEIKGVISCEISADINDGFRDGTVIFFEKANKYYLKRVLMEAGISKLVFSDKEILVSEMESEPVDK